MFSCCCCCCWLPKGIAKPSQFVVVVVVVGCQRALQSPVNLLLLLLLLVAKGHCKAQSREASCSLPSCDPSYAGLHAPLTHRQTQLQKHSSITV